METWPVPSELVDPEALRRWMDNRGLGVGAPLTDAHLLAGGTQNVLLAFERDDRRYVLRRPPRHKRANSDETMRREARLLQALAGTDVPHPGFIAGEPDLDTIGAAFYLMESVDGFCVNNGLPELHASDAAVRHRMGLEMADAIAALGRVDHATRGLDDFGRPGYLERQVPRWQSQLASYADFAGWPGPAAIPAVDEVGRWLAERLPASWRPGVMHGDFHFGNVLFAPDGPTLVAVVDWELATIGDPLVDLGQLLATWPAAGQPGGVGVALADGLPTPSEIVDRYAGGSDRDLAAIDWYTVLACFRLGIILEGSHARACAGLAPTDVGDALHATTVGLFERAATIIAA